MTHTTRTTGMRGRARMATLFALPMFLLAPLAARTAHAETAESSESGPAGTDFVVCHDQAWADYNSCLMRYDSSWEKKLCDLAFEADVAWCAAVYWRRLKAGV